MARSRPSSLRLSRQSTTDSRPEESEGARSRPISRQGDGRKRSQSLESNERSPLLSPKRSEDQQSLIHNGTPTGSLQVEEGAEQKSKSTFYLILLTLSIAGLQIAWGVEMSNGTPYLLSLGINKSMLALVWIAGPFTGVLVQPYIGIKSDNCHVPWGKRKPFMLGGAAATAFAFLALAWMREIVHGFLGLFGADPNSGGVKVTTIVFAIVLIYVLDVAINAVQAAIRAFMVDNAPVHQQEDANSWGGRMTGAGNIACYAAGYIDLPKHTGGIFGNTQFKVLSVITAFALCGTILISVFSIRERDPSRERPASSDATGILFFFRQVFRSFKRLPPQIRKVCDAQFFNWIGWFPFLFYITTYIGQLHVNKYFAANPDLSPEEIDRAWEEATRVGTFALLIFALTGFASNLLLPFLIVPSYQAPSSLRSSLHSSTSHLTYPHSTSSNPGTPGPGTASMTSYFPDPESHSRRARLLSACQIPWLTLRRAWLLAHIIFALCMLATFFITSTTAAIVLAGFIGLPWALTLWAPFALISTEISKRDAEARRAGPNGTTEDQAGVILGLHNVFISAPQILATLLSSAIFKLTQKPRGSPWDDSVGWVLRCGAIAALLAAVMTWRIEEEGVKKEKVKVEDRSE
ncbi:hypothetical protein MMC07_009118, partial [Pseudocyphellaria aurata]|nr:hypothetical protein [Pseudocyphellaria aurata]